MINKAFEYLIRLICRYEGTVTRLMGDAILAFFGTFIAHEDDPQGAVLEGPGILKDTQPFCDEIKHEYGLDFGVRVVIHTDPVVVGNIGSDLAMVDAAGNLIAELLYTKIDPRIELVD